MGEFKDLKEEVEALRYQFVSYRTTIGNSESSSNKLTKVELCCLPRALVEEIIISSLKSFF